MAKLRKSPRPEKQLLWIWVQRDMKKLSGSVGLDLAGGEMSNYDLFRADQYICADIDEERMIQGLAKVPDAKLIHSSLENFDSREIQGDIIVCVQTIGINNLFDAENTMIVVEKIIEATKPNGSAIFNIGSNSISYLPSILNLIEKKFESVTIKSYGNIFFNLQYPKVISLLLAIIMFFLPVFLRGKNKRYIVCKRKMFS